MPVRWLTEITEWDPPHRFVDQQIKGPYALWHHTHEFEPDGTGGTVMRDTVRYAIGPQAARRLGLVTEPQGVPRMAVVCGRYVDRFTLSRAFRRAGWRAVAGCRHTGSSRRRRSSVRRSWK